MGVYFIDIISFMFVLHEFEEEQVRTILKTVKETYPQSQILLTDLIGRSSEEVKKESRTAFPELKFVHQLSKQILRTPTEWKELFSQANFKPTIETTNQLTNQLSVLFTPA